MSKRKKTKEEENLTVSHSTKRCSSSGGGQQYFDMIPIDLIIQIFSRLMCGKTMGKCRCVSKQWSSILRGPNLNQFFPINPPEPPRFLITYQDGRNMLYFSSSQPQNPVKNSSIVATPHHSVDTYVVQICLPVRGWVCHLLHGEFSTTALVFNPITGQSITSPKISLISSYSYTPRCYFGYDPVHNQFKVLCITSVFCRVAKKQTLELEHQVLTLETGNLLWRKIGFCIPYCVIRNENGICINGVIYYKANISLESTIVCFDVRSEKFDFIVGRDGIARKKTILINYKGKLCAAYINGYNLVLWVLEDDAEKQRVWTKHIYKIPLRLRKLYPITGYCFGATGKGEIVFHPYKGEGYPFYIYYYNLEKKSLVRVRVKVPGFDAYRSYRIHSFANYVEEVKLM